MSSIQGRCPLFRSFGSAGLGYWHSGQATWPETQLSIGDQGLTFSADVGFEMNPTKQLSMPYRRIAQRSKQ